LIQRKVAKVITGSLATTAGDALEAHSNLLPIDLLFNKILYRNATHIASLPNTHPLQSLARKAAKCFVKKHCSPLHYLFFTTKVNLSSIKTINITQCRPSYSPPFSTTTLSDKQEALAAAINHHQTQVSVYSDSSGYENGVGASAVMYINNKTEKHSLYYYLSPLSDHIVYKGEIVGLILALHLLKSIHFQLLSYTIIGTDNQAVIKALSNQTSHPAHYLLDQVHDMAEQLQTAQYQLTNTITRHPPTKNVIDLQIHWTPGHSSFPPNVRANELAKQAAQGSSSPCNTLPTSLHKTPIPSSTSALRQSNLSSLKKIWKTHWKSSPRYPKTHAINKSLPSANFLKLTAPLLSSEFRRRCRVQSRARRWLQLVGCAALLLDASNFGGLDGVGESGIEPRRSLRKTRVS